jgi:hypothetical protein
MWISRWRCVIKPAYSFSFLLSINIFNGKTFFTFQMPLVYVLVKKYVKSVQIMPDAMWLHEICSCLELKFHVVAESFHVQVGNSILTLYVVCSQNNIWSQHCYLEFALLWNGNRHNTKQNAGRVLCITNWEIFWHLQQAGESLITYVCHYSIVPTGFPNHSFTDGPLK